MFKCPGVVEGYMSNNVVLVRFKSVNMSKNCGRNLRQFKGLLPQAKASRLYEIPEKELKRQNEQKGQAGKGSVKKAKSS